jgi:nicotinate-nucleotide pyrophosphorylase (carboxylating)
VGKGDEVITAEGPARAILTAERTALNFLQRMTGIATLASAFVARADPHGVIVLDTRKTTPTLRVLEKYAVLCGGGKNHRMGLYDRILIKDNHRCLWRNAGRGDLAEAVKEARKRNPDVEIEIEVESEAELEDVVEAAPDWILLDNMTPGELARCVELCRGRSRLEASGNITLDTMEAVARTGIDAVSLGCLTHSAPAADLSLELAGA